MINQKYHAHFTNIIFWAILVGKWAWLPNREQTPTKKLACCDDLFVWGRLLSRNRVLEFSGLNNPAPPPPPLMSPRCLVHSWNYNYNYKLCSLTAKISKKASVPILHGKFVCCQTCHTSYNAIRYTHKTITYRTPIRLLSSIRNKIV